MSCLDAFGLGLRRLEPEQVASDRRLRHGMNAMALEHRSSVVLRGTRMIGRTAAVTTVVRVPGMHHTCVGAVVSRHASRHRRGERRN